jgi:C4-dicarboxylate transporter DctQ subunit
VGALLVAWRAWDRWLIRGTEFVLFAIGVTFTGLIALEVLSRFVFSFSIFFTNAMARYLLVWFFLLGAGPALRRGAHVGFDMLVQALPLSLRQRIEVLAHVLVLLFLALMIWGGISSLPQAWTEIDSAMGVRSVWGMAAIPVGFALLFYHQACVMIERRVGAGGHEGRRQC